MALPGAPAVVVLHWWSPLEFQGSFWEVAQDELDVISSYYDIQVLYKEALLPRPLTHSNVR